MPCEIEVAIRRRARLEGGDEGRCGMEQIAVAGLRIAYERAGEGPAIVLLHGGLSDSWEWRRQLDALSDEFTVVAWDAPGCGQSSDPPETFRLPAYADCLAAFIYALGLGQPHVVGLSFGGGLALELYRGHPTVPRTLTLASAYAGWAGSLPAEVVEERLQQILRDVDLSPDQWIPGWIPGLFTEAAPQEMIADMVAIMSAYHPAGVRAMARAFAEADLRDVLPRIHVPTLLLYGDADRRAPVQLAEDLHAKIPTSRLVVLPGVGHQSNFEAAERFTAEVRSFLRSAQP
jgi:pimeloyl-ACP methyl ester carboxylesterase